MDENSPVFKMLDEIQARSNGGNAPAGAGAGDAAPPGRPSARSPPRPKSNFTPDRFVKLLSSLQFAVVILIAQRRIPLADRTEFFVVLSMLMLTAAHARIIELLPDPDSIVDDREALKFLFLGAPTFLFMLIIESWFIALLFTYDPAVELVDFRQNARAMLTVCKTLSLLKIIMVAVLLLGPSVLARLRRRAVVLRPAGKRGVQDSLGALSAAA